MWCRRPSAACTGPGAAFLSTPTLSVTCGHRCSTAPGRPCAAPGEFPGRWPFPPREALVLRYFADLPEQETALAMGVSLGTVKSTTSRALAALGRMLQEE